MKGRGREMGEGAAVADAWPDGLGSEQMLYSEVEAGPGAPGKKNSRHDSRELPTVGRATERVVIVTGPQEVRRSNKAGDSRQKCHTSTMAEWLAVRRAFEHVVDNSM